MTRDRFGIGFRPELAAGILSHLDVIDVVEVVAETLFDGDARRMRAMRTLARQVPVVLHGVSLGLASAHVLSEERLARLARVADAIEPFAFSEHLAFVRGDGLEIGHLAAPPRSQATVEGTVRNVERVRAALDLPIALENVATLVAPPSLGFDEASWMAATLTAADTGFLLDLHNLYANARNFGYDARAQLDRLPLQRVSIVHIAGGQSVKSRAGRERWLDDHLHAVPDPVFALLEALGERVRQPLDVILERDGAYPAFSELLLELQLARAALARGRARAQRMEKVA